MDALLASREVHEDLLLDVLADEQLASTARTSKPSFLGRVRTWLQRR